MSKKWTLYHDFDEFKCEVVRQAIKAKAITDGEVICGDIKELQPSDVMGFRRFHAFCGGGFWDLALNRAGWGDAEVWTGSCPCPSFSAAGKGRGFADARHLWPHWMRLIKECKPPVIFGEQVSAAIGHGWLDLVQDDMEAEDYAVGKAVLGACCVGAPHIRQRLWFVAHAGSGASQRVTGSVLAEETGRGEPGFADGDCAVRHSDGGTDGELAHAERGRREQCNEGFRPVSVVDGANGARIVGNAKSDDERRLSVSGLHGARFAAGGPGGTMWLEWPIGAGLEGHVGDGRDGNQPGRDGAQQTRPVAEAGESGGVADVRGIGRGRRQGCAEGHEPNGADAGWVEGDSGIEHGGEDAGRVADTPESRRERFTDAGCSDVFRETACEAEQRKQSGVDSTGSGRVADSEHFGHGGQGRTEAVSGGNQPGERVPDGDCAVEWLGDTERGGFSGGDFRGLGASRAEMGQSQDGASPANQSGYRREDAGRPRPLNGFWRDADWIGCRDGKWRPVPGTAQPGAIGVADECAADLGYFLLPGERGYAFSPLVQKGKERVGRLRLYGDGIVVEVATAFIASVMDIVG